VGESVGREWIRSFTPDDSPGRVSVVSVRRRDGVWRKPDRLTSDSRTAVDLPISSARSTFGRVRCRVGLLVSGAVAAALAFVAVIFVILTGRIARWLLLATAGQRLNVATIAAWSVGADGGVGSSVIDGRGLAATISTAGRLSGFTSRWEANM
jgi:hypothetical protein